MHIRHLFALLLVGATLWTVSCPNSAEAGDQSGTTVGQSQPVRAHSWSSDDFKFKSIIADPGGKEIGGWQEAEVTLTIIDGRHVYPNKWDCDVLIGVPYRTSTGPIGPGYAASIANDIATTAADQVIVRQSSWTRGLFCSQFKNEMTAAFESGGRYRWVGGRVKKCQ